MRNDKVLRALLCIGICACASATSIRLCVADDTLQNPRTWEPVSAGPVTAWTAPHCGKGKLVIQPFIFYNRVRGSFDSEGKLIKLSDGDDSYQLMQQFFMQWGISERLEVDAQTVYQESYTTQSDLRAHAQGIGDSFLFLRYCFYDETKYIPDIAGLFQIKVPSAKYQDADPNKLGTDLMGAATGAGSWAYGIGLNFTKKFKPFVLHADAVYNFPQEVSIDDVETRHGRYLNYDVALEWILPKGFNLLAEFNALTQRDRLQRGQKIVDSGVKQFVISPGIGWSNKKFQTLLAYQRTLRGRNVAASDAIVFTIVYTFNVSGGKPQ